MKKINIMVGILFLIIWTGISFAMQKTETFEIEGRKVSVFRNGKEIFSYTFAWDKVADVRLWRYGRHKKDLFLCVFLGKKYKKFCIFRVHDKKKMLLLKCKSRIIRQWVEGSLFFLRLQDGDFYIFQACHREIRSYNHLLEGEIVYTKIVDAKRPNEFLHIGLKNGAFYRYKLYDPAMAFFYKKFHSPVVYTKCNNEFLCVGLHDHTFYAFNNGMYAKPLFEYRFEAPIIYSKFFSKAGLIILHSEDGKLYVFDITRGISTRGPKLICCHQLDSQIQWIKLTKNHRALGIQLKNNAFYLLDIKSGGRILFNHAFEAPICNACFDCKNKNCTFTLYNKKLYFFEFADKEEKNNNKRPLINFQLDHEFFEKVIILQKGHKKFFIITSHHKLMVFDCDNPGKPLGECQFTNCDRVRICRNQNVLLCVKGDELFVLDPFSKRQCHISFTYQARQVPGEIRYVEYHNGLLFVGLERDLLKIHIFDLTGHWGGTNMNPFFSMRAHGFKSTDIAYIGYHNGLLYVGLHNKKFYAFKNQRRVPVFKGTFAIPVVYARHHDNLIYVGLENGKFYIINMKTKKKVLRLNFASPVCSDASDADFLCIGCANRDCYIVDKRKDDPKEEWDEGWRRFLFGSTIRAMYREKEKPDILKVYVKNDTLRPYEFDLHDNVNQVVDSDDEVRVFQYRDRQAKADKKERIAFLCQEYEGDEDVLLEKKKIALQLKGTKKLYLPKLLAYIG